VCKKCKPIIDVIIFVIIIRNPSIQLFIIKGRQFINNLTKRVKLVFAIILVWDLKVGFIDAFQAKFILLFVSVTKL